MSLAKHIQQRGRAGAGRPHTPGGLAIVAGLGVHIVLNSVLKEFPLEDPIEVAALASLAWFLCMGVYMWVRGDS